MTIRPGAIAIGLSAWMAGAPAAAEKPLLLLDSEHVERVRARLIADRLKVQADDALRQALAVLEKDATEALALEPLSVMDKAVMPPSGDKHDYMSQAPYWWPDPSKPGGLPYIRKDGVRNPEIARISDHANFDRVMASVATLGLAYKLTGRTDCALHVYRLVKTWFLDPATRMNPHLRYGQGIPGVIEGRGIGIIETRALPRLLDGITLTSSSPVWTMADIDGLHAWMRAYLTWLVESPHGREEARNGNNHETWYDVQVASLAMFVGDTALARRTVEGARERIRTQIEPDGRQPRELERTQPWHYSLFNLEAFFALAVLGDRVGVDLWNYRTQDGRSLRRALDYLVPFADGRQPWPHPQIGAFQPAGIAPLLRRGALVWKDPAYGALAGRLGADPRGVLTGPD
jgi:hypothetical protein